MTPETDIPLRQVGAELAFRTTLTAFSQAFWDIHPVGNPLLPPGPCFIYGNHSNNYDPFILNALTELGQGTAGVMTMEYLERGPIAALFRAVGIEGTRKRVPEPHLIRRIARLLDAGRRIVIFPEGGRRWDGRPAPWIESTAKLFQRMGVPVYPVRIHGSYVSWPRWARWPRPARIGVEVCPAVPLTRSMTLDQVLEALRAPIAADENLVDDSHRPAWAWRPAEGLDRLLYRDPGTGSFHGARIRSGRHLVSEDGHTQWKVLPDSRLQTMDGTVVHAADLYRDIRSMDLPTAADGTVIAHAGRYTVGPDDGTRRAYENGPVALATTHVRFGSTRLPLESLRYAGIERSDRLWLVGGGVRVYCHFPPGTSPLAWYDTLHRLAPHINA